MKLFSINKSGTFAFSSTTPQYLVFGATQATVTPAFDNQVELDVYSLNGKSISNIKTTAVYTSVDWSVAQDIYGSKSGLIVTAQEDGTISFYSGDKMYANSICIN